MAYEIVAGDNWKRTIKFEVPAEEIKEQYEQSLRQARKLFTMPGFRAGKVPRQIVEKRLKEQLVQDTLESIRADSFEEALKEDEPESGRFSGHRGSR
ncbi:MAG: trigger factor family protein [Planctomycetota bacterium]|nr:trigger factor family protein [Planctomycetota bacterium]